VRDEERAGDECDDPPEEANATFEAVEAHDGFTRSGGLAARSTCEARFRLRR
jgi:hypothetical protein